MFVSLHDLNLMLGLPPTLDPASGEAGQTLARPGLWLGMGESQASREQTSLIRTISQAITQAARDYIIMGCVGGVCELRLLQYYISSSDFIAV